MVPIIFLGLFFFLLVTRVGIEIMQPKGAFFDKVLGRHCRTVEVTRDAGDMSPFEVPVPQQVDDIQVTSATTGNVTNFNVRYFYFTSTYMISTADQWRKPQSITVDPPEVLARKEEERRRREEEHRRRQRLRHLKGRMERMKMLREQNDAERKAQELMRDVLGQERCLEYKRYGSLRLEAHGEEWDIGPNTILRKLDDDGNPFRASWDGSLVVRGYNVVWSRSATHPIPRADRVLALFLEMQDKDRKERLLRICCRSERALGYYTCRRRHRDSSYVYLSYLPDPLKEL